MSFELPYPPSANRYWRHNRGIIHVSAEVREYRRRAALIALSQKVRPIAGDVELSLEVYRPARRGDLDNAMKVLIDALRGVAYEDDKQICAIYAERFEDKKNPRVKVVVSGR